MGRRAAVHGERLPHLLHQILSGNSGALGELYAAFAGDVFRIAYRILGSVPDAEDIMQDVFLGMATALRSYDHTSSYGFRRWLERITVRLAATRARRFDRGGEVPLHSVPAPADKPRRTILQLALTRALGRLTPTLQTVFVLKVVEGHSHKEISSMLGISVGASEVRLHRARRQLRLILGDEWTMPA